MVPVNMRQKQRRLHRRGRLREKRIAERPEARSRVQYESLASTFDLDATRITADTRRGRTGRRDTSAYAPKSDLHGLSAFRVTRQRL